jgi:hypothetical protein
LQQLERFDNYGDLNRNGVPYERGERQYGYLVIEDGPRRPDLQFVFQDFLAIVWTLETESVLPMPYLTVHSMQLHDILDDSFVLGRH